MPLTKSGVDVLRNMKKTYKDPKKAESVFYASQNKGIAGSDKWEAKTPDSEVAAKKANKLTKLKLIQSRLK